MKQRKVSINKKFIVKEVLVYELTTKLNKSFITPIEREDILTLSITMALIAGKLQTNDDIQL